MRIRKEEREAVMSVLERDDLTADTMAEELYAVVYRAIQARDTYGIRADTGSGLVAFAPFLTQREAAKHAAALTTGGWETRVCWVKGLNALFAQSVTNPELPIG